MPHKPIVRENKSSTKVRMVFDASSSSATKTKQDRSLSLNDCLISGPHLTPPLLDTLLRFRAHNNAVVADIEKAFLQIDIVPKQRNYVRFLWFADIENIDFENFENNDLVEHRVCRVLFGLTSSPFLLTATLMKHIKQYEFENEEIVKELLQSLHVDDLNSGKQTVDEAYKFM